MSGPLVATAKQQAALFHIGIDMSQHPGRTQAYLCSSDLDSQRTSHQCLMSDRGVTLPNEPIGEVKPRDFRNSEMLRNHKM